MKPLAMSVAFALLGSYTLFGDEAQPKPKRTPQKVRPAIFADPRLDKHRSSAKWDAHWSKYELYLQRLVDRVQVEFDRNCEQTAKLPATGTIIVMTFKLQKTGAVTDVKLVEGDANSTAAVICTNAVSNNKTYEPWTDEMVKDLGESQEFTWTFHFGPA